MAVLRGAQPVHWERVAAIGISLWAGTFVVAVIALAGLEVMARRTAAPSWRLPARIARGAVIVMVAVTAYLALMLLVT
jgi:hypothetical protein